MRLFLVGPSLDQRGGVVSVILGLNDFLVSQGADVKVIPTTSAGGASKRFLVFIRAFVVIFYACAMRRADIVHLHMASRGSCLRKSIVGLVCSLCGVPFIIHLHGAEFKEFYGEELRGLGRAIVKSVFHRARKVIALSESWKEWLESAMGLKDVAVVFNGVPDLHSTERSVRNSPTILFLGRLGARKGTDELIAAMRQLTFCVSGVVLELGGDGDVERYREVAADLPNVRFLGWVGEAERRAAFGRATVFCLPSWSEGLPMSVLEAMSAGLPVVSTPVGGIPEAVEDGVTGLLVQPGDVDGLVSALGRILLDSADGLRMGREGRTRYLESFSTEAMGRKCLDVYADCLVERK